jgi:CysZ protein
MIRAFTLALGDLADRRIIGILLRSLIITLLIFAVSGIAAAWLLDGADPCDWIGLDSCPLDAPASGWSALLLMLLGVWFLFPAIALGVISGYVDRIAAAIEARHYSDVSASARPLGISGALALGLKSSLRLIFYNLVALPFYIVLLFTGIGALMLFVAVNGLAFGHDLGELVASRHGDKPGRRLWLASTRAPRALIGMLVMGIFLVPFVNLLAPVLGVAMTVHLYHGRRPPIIVPQPPSGA